MRKLLISLLMAGAAATPALASPQSDRQQAREERAQAREERAQAREERQQAREAQPARSADVERPQVARPDRPVPQLRPVDHQVRVEDVEAARSARRDSVDLSRAGRIEQRQELVHQRRDTRALRQSERALPRVMQSRPPVVSHIPREGTQPPPPVTARPASQPQWSTSWRHNNKYDWHNWRKKHRSWFHLGFYYDPFGWGYSPYEIGWRLWPSYYSSRYWISDPWRYRLPYAPPGYRWVRYWDDAVLVDTWTGEVVDVIYSFFW